MKHSFRISFAFVLLHVLMLSHNVFAQYAIPDKMKWWYEDRFGMFIHFGSYSYLAHGEWAFAVEKWSKSNYQTQVSSNFNPVAFDAGAIARLARNAGMKYIVITAKHHEGFCMWDTQVESFKDVTGTKAYDLPGFTRFGSRDILKELKDSCDANGVKFCVYYSILDWNHSSQTIYNQNYSTMASDSARASYIQDMKAQLRELIERYHPAIMWFDGDWTYNAGAPTPSSWWTKTDGIDLYNYLIALDPNLVVNERVIRGYGLGDYECPEQQIPASPRARPWETCQTMNNSWGYNQWDNSYKSLKELINQLATVASRDGNYLLNIGPKGDGTVPSQTVAQLTDFGKWMDVNGESIYGTTRSPFKTEPDWGVFTKKDGKLFAHILTWPTDGYLRVSSLTTPVRKVFFMNDPATPIQFIDTTGVITIHLPAVAPDVNNSVLAFDVTGVPAASKSYFKVTRIVVKSIRGTTSISVGDTLRLTTAISPSNASLKTVSWISSDTTKAIVSQEGIVTAKGSGSVKAIAIANDGTYLRGELPLTIVSATGVKDESHAIPGTPMLHQNYPNPFNPVTTISFTLPEKSYVTMKVYNTFGAEISTLTSGEMPAGQYSTQWDASGLSSGIYYCRLQGNYFTATKKLILMK